jgi:ABC-type amino acid transport substrate-binding protein
MRLLALLLAASLAFPAGAQTLEKIRKAGVIKLGYIDLAAPFSYADPSGQPQGYSVGLCLAVAEGIAEQLKRPDLKKRWVKLTPQTRIDAVRRGQVDLECSTATWTLGRQKRVDFSLITFLDGATVMTRLGSGVRALPDLTGKRIAVIRATTTEVALRDALKRAVVSAELVPVKNREEGLQMLRDSKADGFASDRTSLIGIVAQKGSGDAFALLDEDFSIEQYALMLPRGDADFRVAVNRTLARLYRSGDIRGVYDRWLGPLGPPSPLLSATFFIQGVAE